MAAYFLATVAVGDTPTACFAQGDAFWPLGEAARLLGSQSVPASLIGLFSDWPAHRETVKQIASRLDEMERSAPQIAIRNGDARVLSPLRFPGKVLCSGANYYDHLAEMGVQELRKENQR